MKFKDLKVGDKFRVINASEANWELVKVEQRQLPHIQKKAEYNAVIKSLCGERGELALVGDNAEVEKL